MIDPIYLLNHYLQFYGCILVQYFNYANSCCLIHSVQLRLRVETVNYYFAAVAFVRVTAAFVFASLVALLCLFFDILSGA